ncbi:DUF4214 domain-containing protein [Pseudoduganella namucuonensis]|uniref:DUF4214 domain-containing protein n=1 Tax=Pseudoduganella namucuonensis TaxID=1035707 RepID=A0A1I7EZB3_9BURK|nr:DUF4214 domain-containing protein [Pseudoduganella namucuonensis]SFU29278.1 protein of unknown function [Pseudoduganella namucuonensis]
MRSLSRVLSACCFAVIAGCGGDYTDTSSPVQQRLALGAPARAIEPLTLAGDRDSYAISNTGAGYRIAGAGGESIAAATSVKRIRFADVSLALDGEVAGNVYRLYQAAFNRTPDVAGLGYWLGQFDGGTQLEQIAAAFVASEEFSRLYGATPTDQQFITALYANVLHRVPDAGGLDYWMKSLQAGVSRPAVLIAFAASTENRTQTASAIEAGIAYAETGVAYRPVAKSATQSDVTAGAAVMLDGSASSDANGDRLLYDWSVTNPNGGKAIVTPLPAGKATFIADMAGSYSVTLLANDGKLVSQPFQHLVLAKARAVAPIADTGVYKCTAIDHDLALSLYSQGHTYLDRDHDGKPCEATDKTAETPVTAPVTPPTTTGKCWVNGYRRSNGTYVSGYWRKC